MDKKGMLQMKQGIKFCIIWSIAGSLTSGIFSASTRKVAYKALQE